MYIAYEAQQHQNNETGKLYVSFSTFQHGDNSTVHLKKLISTYDRVAISVQLPILIIAMLIANVFGSEYWYTSND